MRADSSVTAEHKVNRYGSDISYYLQQEERRDTLSEPSVEARHGFRYQFPRVTRSAWQLWYNFRAER